jgi:choline dehydrogenase-like flavoprotein
MVPGVKTFFEACIETGIPLCPDNNSGNPVGVGLAQFNVRHGERSYAANAFLDAPTRNSLKNLTIMTETDCDKIHTTNGVVTGVDLYHRPRAQTIHVQCRNEVIVCAGTFGSVKILNLSGIGPRNVLEKHNIPVVKDLSGDGCSQSRQR